jgi:rhodanese-related sulfurtransferase
VSLEALAEAAPTGTASAVDPAGTVSPSPGPVELADPPGAADPAAADPVPPPPATDPAGRPHPATTIEESPAATSQAPAPDPYPDLPASEFPIEANLAQAAALYARGGLLVLDAREPEEFAEGHIRGAVSTPYNVLAGDPEGFARIAGDPRPILAYCGGGNCEVSMDLAFEILRAGHSRVLVLMDGFPAWEEGGHPVSRGETP